jgi:isoleucyl-tRNA synthetase
MSAILRTLKEVPGPTQISFPKLEEEIGAYWKEIDAFHTQLKKSKGRPEYVFYDGPPFATGLPHYGHILAGSIKDIVTRWQTLTGFYVPRRFGWDCHGLPIEYEIDKKLGINGREDVLNLSKETNSKLLPETVAQGKTGVAAYNEECRATVMKYSKEWEIIMTRLGRWIDFKDDYKTMDMNFMESVWWVFKTLHDDKELVYRGFKVMPYSTACNTPLSNFEAGLNYKDTPDPEVVVAFPLVDDPNTNMVAWTTTPWTLPSNLALCVHPKFEYHRLQEKGASASFWILKERVEAFSKWTKKKYQVAEKRTGAELKGLRYKPLFDYFAGIKGNTFWQVLNDEYVTSEAGTGTVHQAPAFGEDDNRVCLAAGICTKTSVVCPIDDNGCFTDEVPDFQGLHVKAADKDIVKKLKAEGRVLFAGTLQHSYPFCWRSDAPHLQDRAELLCECREN